MVACSINFKDKTSIFVHVWWLATGEIRKSKFKVEFLSWISTKVKNHWKLRDDPGFHVQIWIDFSFFSYVISVVTACYWVTHCILQNKLTEAM